MTDRSYFREWRRDERTLRRPAVLEKGGQLAWLVEDWGQTTYPSTSAGKSVRGNPGKVHKDRHSSRRIAKTIIEVRANVTNSFGRQAILRDGGTFPSANISGNCFKKEIDTPRGPILVKCITQLPRLRQD
ncbi:hypothetical protein Bbelb_375520 [Branchiostoma belcheri]|nr:hypothetical protein Bbelb_375520 [Branchiostoma belcheri]